MLNYATKLLGPCAALLLSTPALAQANAFSTLAVEANILIQSYEEKAVLCQDVVREGGMSHEYCQQMVELGTSAANALGKVKDAAKSNDDEIVVEILRLRLVAAEDAEAEVWAIVN